MLRACPAALLARCLVLVAVVSVGLGMAGSAWALGPQRIVQPLMVTGIEYDHLSFYDPGQTVSGGFFVTSGSAGGTDISPDGAHFNNCQTVSTTGAYYGSPVTQLVTSSSPYWAGDGSGGCTAGAWMDSNHVVFANYHTPFSTWTNVVVYDLATGSTNLLFRTWLYPNYSGSPTVDGVVLNGGVTGLSYSPRGDRLALDVSGFCGSTSQPVEAVYSMVVGTGSSSLTRVAGGSCADPHAIAARPVFSKTGELAYLYTADSTASPVSWDFYISADGLNPGIGVTDVAAPSAADFQSATFSPSGSHFSYCYGTGGAKDLYIDQDVLLSGWGHCYGAGYAWSADESTIAYVSDTCGSQIPGEWSNGVCYLHLFNLLHAAGTPPSGNSDEDYNTTIKVWGPGNLAWGRFLNPSPPIGSTFGSTSGTPPPGTDQPAVITSGALGEPVNTATGSFYTSAVDLSLPGIGVPFTFTRSYNSADSSTGTLGAGWTDNLNWSLAVDGSSNVTVRSGSGQTLHFTHQSGGSLLADPGGRATLTTISGGYELVTTDQNHYAFNSSGKLTSETDRNGHGLSLSYDGSGYLQSVTDSVGRTIDFTTTSGHLTEIDLPDGRSVSYVYTGGKLTSFTDLNGHTVSYTYDGNGLLASITDQNGNSAVANVYDGTSGRVTEQTDGRGHHSYFDWDPDTQTATYTDPRGKVWTQVYEGYVLQSETNPLGKTTSYGYDGDLNTTTITNPAGNSWVMDYDGNGNLLSRTAPAPLSYTQSWTYDAFNDVSSYTNGRGKTTSYGYDGAGNLTSVTGPDPDGAGGASAPETDYGLDGTTKQVTSVTDPRGKETDFGYDADGNLTSVTSPEGEETTMGYDAGGRMTSKVEARGNESGATAADYTWTYSYDDANHKLTQTDPLSNETDWTYYPGGQLETVTDANNHTTTYSYDDDNNLSTVTTPDSQISSYSYDNNNLLSKEDANSHTTTYTYDDANHLASKELPGGQT